MIARADDPRLSSAGEKRVWTIGDLLVWTEAHFKKLGMASPRLDAELLLASAMGTSRLELYTGYHKVVQPDERARFRSLVERRGRFEPVAYILGTREFYSLAFEVTPAVLIPRPETEHLIDQILATVKRWGSEGALPAPLRILDLGTGSGNIAIALASQLREALVTATDLSAGALEVAQRNARRHHVEDRLTFLQGDLFAPLRERPEKYHIIVSNPPYVAASEFPGLMQDVRDHEPKLALVDQKAGNGLGYYQAIAGESRRFLSQDPPAASRLLAFEVGDLQAKAVSEMLQAAGWEGIHVVSDYAGIARVVTATATAASGATAPTRS